MKSVGWPCRSTVNANGELVVLHEEDLVGANFRCLGPKE
jgi:hypothetical protein